MEEYTEKSNFVYVDKLKAMLCRFYLYPEDAELVKVDRETFTKIIKTYKLRKKRSRHLAFDFLHVGIYDYDTQKYKIYISPSIKFKGAKLT